MSKTVVWTRVLTLLFLLSGCSTESSSEADVIADTVASEEAVLPDCVLDEECDDGDFCTLNSCDAGVCTAVTRECDDGLFCSGTESCDSAAGMCVVADVPVVDDGIECTVDLCDEELDQVVNQPDGGRCDDLDPCTDDLCDAANGCTNPFNVAPCDDGDLCTIDDACLEGACAGIEVICDDTLYCNGVESCDPDSGDCLKGEAPATDDGVDCTDDSCDEDADEVINQPVDTPCDDGDPCTDDWCDSAAGCVHDNNLEPCDDGLACTINDTCFQGTCAGYSKECDDALFCNGLESCDDVTGECLDGWAPLIDDALACTIDLCDDELDEVVHLPVDADCDDGDICTDDICSPAEGCVHEFNLNPCTDGDPCTVLDQCLDGLCAGAPKDCDDALYCNGEESCDPVTGVCLSGSPPDADDGIDCTDDSCDEENDLLVNVAVDVACDDFNPCTDDSCAVEEGCQHVNNAAACDDLDPCTLEDICLDGACGGTPKLCDDSLYCNGVESCEPESGDCLPGTPPDHGDEVDCTLDGCDEESDSIFHTPDHTKCGDDNVCTDDSCHHLEGCLNVNNSSECDDGVACTIQDLCTGGICAGEPTVCTNSLFCDGLETCSPQSGECVDGEAPESDDLIACTADSCDEVNDVVVHDPDGTLCNDDNGCTDDFCDPELGCVFSPNFAACDDSEECTDGDTCGDGSCQAGDWICEDCTNDLDDNNDGATDCCDLLCADLPACQFEAGCGDESDNDCDGVTDCADLDCLGSAACGPYPLPGDLVITEVMQDPNAVGDSVGEWFEIYNVAAETFDLRFMEVTDDGDNTFVVNAGLSIAPGESLVFGRNGDQEVNGGIEVDYVYKNFLLSNADDEIRLLLNDVEVDVLGYDGGPLFPDPTGASMQLDPASTTAEDNDVPANWCVSRRPVTEDEGADLGTPGAVNHPCHEVDCEEAVDDDFDGATDCDDEDCGYLEGCGDHDQDGIYNRDEICPGWDDNIDEDNDEIPDGCEIEVVWNAIPASGSDWGIAGPLHVELEVLMAGVTDSDGAGEGIACTMSYLVAGKDDWIELAMVYVSEGGGGADILRGSVPALSVVPGLSVTTNFVCSYTTANEINYVYNNDAIADLNSEPVPFIYVAAGNAPTPNAGELIITEILKNPEHVSDAAGEWFEVYVAADHVVDLKGVELADNDANSHHVMVSVYGEPGAYLVLGANGIFGQNGGVSLDYAYEGISLGNDGDEVLLFNGNELIDGVIYDAGATFPDKPGAALNLSGDLLDVISNDDGANWCDATTPFGSGDLGTPGEVNPICE